MRMYKENNRKPTVFKQGESVKVPAGLQIPEGIA